MALREHTDGSGVTWQVWHVVPTTRSSAAATQPPLRGGADSSSDRPRKRFTLTPGMEDGWLCFESPGEKRRLAPVPEDWESCDDEALARYLSAAAPVSRRSGADARGEERDPSGPQTRAAAG